MKLRSIKVHLFDGMSALTTAWFRARDGDWRAAWNSLGTYVLNMHRLFQNKFYPGNHVECPCCGWSGYGFLYMDCGKFSVPNAVCPKCRSQERHRMMHMFLTRRPPEFLHTPVPGKVLHFASEPQIRCFLDANPNLVTYVTDYISQMVKGVPRPGFVADIQHMPLPDNCMDGLFCLHVLEHVPDDSRAIHELWRVLKKDGQAIIIVPFFPDQPTTIEYGAPNSHMFGHVRAYSPHDFKYRLEPFHYEEWFPASFLSQEEINRFQIPSDSQIIYLCRKQ